MKKYAGIAVLLAFFIAACVSTGKDFEVTKVHSIKNGVTKKSQIQGWFGYPYMTGIDNGDETWIYNFTKMLGGSTQAKNLYIVFDKLGVVKDHTFSTSFPDEMTLPK